MCEAFSSSEAYQSLAAIETITVTGRTRQPLVRKLNLFWWFMNDFEPTPPDWYRPTQPLRTLFWYLRNPLQNAGRYVLGVADRNYTVTGMWPVLETVWEDVRWSDFPHFAPRHGWKRATLKLENGRSLPWISYSTPRWLAYWGWQPNGFAGVKFNRLAYLFSPLLPFVFVALVLVRLWALMPATARATHREIQGCAQRITDR
jgi:hypothetical protein